MSKKTGSVYRIVHTDLWADQKFLALSALRPTAQTLWLVLLLHPENGPIPGLITENLAGLSAWLGWPLAATRKSMAELEGAGMARCDDRASLIWLPKAIQWNFPANGNMVKSWKIRWKNTRSCPLKDEIAEALRGTVGQRYPEQLAEALAAGPANGMANGSGNGMANGSAGGQGNAVMNRSPDRSANGAGNGTGTQDSGLRTQDSGSPPAPSGGEDVLSSGSVEASVPATDRPAASGGASKPGASVPPPIAAPAAQGNLVVEDGIPRLLRHAPDYSDVIVQPGRYTASEFQRLHPLAQKLAAEYDRLTKNPNKGGGHFAALNTMAHGIPYDFLLACVRRYARHLASNPAAANLTGSKGFFGEDKWRAWAREGQEPAPRPAASPLPPPRTAEELAAARDALRQGKTKRAGGAPGEEPHG